MSLYILKATCKNESYSYALFSSQLEMCESIAAIDNIRLFPLKLTGKRIQACHFSCEDIRLEHLYEKSIDRCLDVTIESPRPDFIESIEAKTKDLENEVKHLKSEVIHLEKQRVLYRHPDYTTQFDNLIKLASILSTTPKTFFWGATMYDTSFSELLQILHDRKHFTEVKFIGTIDNGKCFVTYHKETV